jgi:hypothetical protein
MAACLKDLRLVALPALDRGRPSKEAAGTFGVFPVKIKRWLNRRRAGYRCQNMHRRLCSLEIRHNAYERCGQELDNGLIIFCRACHSTFHRYLRVSC